MAGDNELAFHARMDLAEPGLYRATYHRLELTTQPKVEALRDGPPDTHIGTDPQGLKLWVEEMARGLGFETVHWESLPPEAR